MAEYQRKFEQFQQRHAAGSNGFSSQESPRSASSDETPTASAGHQCVELCPICRTADVLRATLPPETREQFYAIQREALLALRALLDHYIEQTGAGSNGSAQVEEIPID